MDVAPVSKHGEAVLRAPRVKQLDGGDDYGVPAERCPVPLV